VVDGESSWKSKGRSGLQFRWAGNFDWGGANFSKAAIVSGNADVAVAFRDFRKFDQSGKIFTRTG